MRDHGADLSHLVHLSRAITLLSPSSLMPLESICEALPHSFRVRKHETFGELSIPRQHEAARRCAAPAEALQVGTQVA